MADEVETIVLKAHVGSTIDNLPTPPNEDELIIETKESVMELHTSTDYQENVASTTNTSTKGYQENDIPCSNGTPKKEVYCQPSSIPQLAAAASLNKKVPTAGGYAIDRCKEPSVYCPPECMLYEDQPSWVLGKMNPAALVDHDEPEPELAEPEVTQGEEIDEAKELAESSEILMEDINKNIISVPKPIKTRPKTPTRRSTSRPGTGKSPVPSPRGKQTVEASKLTKSSALDDAANKNVTSPRSGIKKTVTSKTKPSPIGDNRKFHF